MREGKVYNLTRVPGPLGQVTKVSSCFLLSSIESNNIGRFIEAWILLADILEAGLGLLPQPDDKDAQDNPECDMAQNDRATLSSVPSNYEPGPDSLNRLHPSGCPFNGFGRVEN